MRAAKDCVGHGVGAIRLHDFRPILRHNLTGADHERCDDEEIHHHADEHARRDAHAHQTACAHHREIEDNMDTEFIEAHALDVRHPQPCIILRQIVVPRVESIRDLVERVLHFRCAEHADLQDRHIAACNEQLKSCTECCCARECFGLEDARFDAGRARGCIRDRHPVHHILRATLRRFWIERVEHDRARATFRERLLFIVDEASLHGERNHHAEQTRDDVPDEHLVPLHRGVGHKHVRHERGDKRTGHVARGCRDGLHSVVLKDRHVLGQERLREHAEHHERKDDAGHANAECPACLRTDVKIRCAENAAEEEACEGGANRQLRHVSAEDVLQPPTVLLLTSPSANFFVRQVGQCHRRRL